MTTHIQQIKFTQNKTDRAQMCQNYVARLRDASEFAWALRNQLYVLAAKLMPYTDEEQRDQSLLEAARTNHVEAVTMLIAHANPLFNNSQALHQACQYNNMECVTLLLEVSDVNASQGAAGMAAAMNNHIDVIKFLAPHLNQLSLENSAKIAINAKHFDVAEVLLSYLEQAGIELLGAVCDYGDVHLLNKLLNKKTDQDAKNEALYRSVFWDNQDCIDVLYDISDPDTVLQRLQEHIGYNKDDYPYFLERIKAGEEQKTLTQALTVQHKKSKKKNKI